MGDLGLHHMVEMEDDLGAQVLVASMMKLLFHCQGEMREMFLMFRS
jgi:hypothetical protein